jgi:hypothetical protein
MAPTPAADHSVRPRQPAQRDIIPALWAITGGIHTLTTAGIHPRGAWDYVPALD